MTRSRGRSAIDAAIETAEFAYDLPEDRIAQVPANPRDAARLLVDGGPGRPVRHRHVADLAEECRPGDLVVVNDTRVLPARLDLRRPGGGALEALVLEPSVEGTWEALLRPSRRARVGDLLATATGEPAAEVVDALGEGRWRLRWCFDGAPSSPQDVPASTQESAAAARAAAGEGEPTAVIAFLERHGQVPLPPYLAGPLDDPERYQTVYARRPGSVAAPTAGLHLTPGLLDRLAGAGVAVARLELVVGLGTFRPITAERVGDHVMHAEAYRVPDETVAAVAAADRVLAVGTTVVRALESWAATGRPEGRTDLFIRRGHRFAVVDRLLTNFHVPRSSLLVLVDALIGPRWRQLYREALAEGYRFLSLGDAMLVERTAP